MLLLLIAAAAAACCCLLLLPPLLVLLLLHPLLMLLLLDGFIIVFRIPHLSQTQFIAFHSSFQHACRGLTVLFGRMRLQGLHSASMPISGLNRE
jgi:hypothetical protein